MNYGKFFKLNNEKSDLSSGITCYDYIWLCDNENNIKFPIYVTISKDSIDFHVHYHDEHKHLHNTILSLPLSANLDVKDGLTGALVEGWETNFPRREEDGSNYLFKLLFRTIILDDNDNLVYYSDHVIFGNKKEKKENDKKEREKERIIDSIINQVENLAGKIPDKKADENKISKYIETVVHKIDSVKPLFKHFIRKLILDFMFDLEHTKIFQTSSHYEHISVKLKENYFFNALAAKANFYYQKILMIENRSNIDIEYYLKAEKQWTKCIRSPKAQTNFNDFQDKWFDDPEEEMERVYGKDFNYVNGLVEIYTYKKDKDGILEHKTQKEEIEKSRNKSSKWLVWHYKWPILWKNKDFLGWHLLFPKLIASILVVWVTVIIGSDLLPAMLDTDEIENFRVFHLSWELYFFDLGVLCIIYFMLNYSIQKRSPNIRKSNKYKYWCSKFFWLFIVRPFKICFLSFFSSLIIGIPLIMIFSKVPITFPWNCNSSGVPNPFFWSCVFLAMFIGVVLQQVTDEKYTEE